VTSTGGGYVGAMDALLLLTGDHNRVRGLFKSFKEAHEKKDQQRGQQLAEKIIRELTVHTEIEETVFYPAVRDAGDEKLTELVVEGYEEHAVVKELIEEVKACNPGDERWHAKMTVIIENVEHHAQEEETQMWPKVESALDSASLQALAERLEAKKRELGAPTTADTIDLTKTALTELAKEQAIPGRSKMTQEELAAAVSPG
jgi:hemerythrin superfamily protein